MEDNDGNHLPMRVNRWHEAIGGTVLYKVREDGGKQKQPRIESVRVLNDLPDTFPEDINYDYYIDAARHPKEKKASRRRKAEKLTDAERQEWEDWQTETEANVEFLLSLNLNPFRDMYTGLIAHSKSLCAQGALEGQSWPLQGRSHLVLRVVQHRRWLFRRLPKTQEHAGAHRLDR